MDSYNNSAAMAGAMAGMMMTILIWCSIMGLFFTICNWVFLTKAGKPGWISIIPIYNAIVYLEVIGKPWWWLILFFIPVVGFVIYIMALNELSKSFGKGTGFTIGLLFLFPIFIAILAFGGAKYVGPGGGGVPTVSPAMA